MKTAEEILMQKPNTLIGLDAFFGWQTTVNAMEEYADQFKPKWVPIKTGDEVEEGWYWVLLENPDTGIKKQSVYFLLDIMPYKYATHICRVQLPTKP